MQNNAQDNVSFALCVADSQKSKTDLAQLQALSKIRIK
jgi:hypothetical protein